MMRSDTVFAFSQPTLPHNLTHHFDFPSTFSFTVASIVFILFTHEYHTRDSTAEISPQTT